MERWETLLGLISERGRVLVAFSGGVDSSLLAKAATDVLGRDALCVLLDSETLPRVELARAVHIAETMGLNLRISQISILEDEEFLKNTPSRCYLCKRRSMRDLKAMAAAEGIESVADGLNLSDYGDYRPGILACDEEGIWHPFVEAGMTKEEIREVCRLLGLPFWNSPSSACLATRIPYGQRIEPVDLRRVEEAESYLGSLGFQQVRVRSHGDLARVELLRGDAERALALRDEISERLRDIGYCYVALDLDGFRSGRMNEALWRSHP